MLARTSFMLVRFTFLGVALGAIPFVSATAVSAGEAMRPAAADEPIPVLIVTGENNHDWKATTPKIRLALEETGRFAVDVTEKAAETLADANAIAKYRAFVLNYNGPRW